MRSRYMGVVHLLMHQHCFLQFQITDVHFTIGTMQREQAESLSVITVVLNVFSFFSLSGADLFKSTLKPHLQRIKAGDLKYI